MTLLALKTQRQSFSSERILSLVGIGIAVSLLGDAALYVILPTQYAQAGLLISHVGLMLSANRLIRIFLNSPLGILVERVPRRRILIPALFLGAFSSILYTIPGFWTILIGRLLWGAAWSGIAIGATTIILDIATDENRGRYVGRYQMWFFIGIGTSSLLGGLLFDAIGYIATFYVATGIVLTIAIIWFLFLPETRDRNSTNQLLATSNEQDTIHPITQLKTKTDSLFPLVIAILVNGLNWLVFVGMALAILPLLLQERVGEEIIIAGTITILLVSFTGLLTAFNTGISLITSLISGWLSDWSQDRWLILILGLALGVVSLTITAIGDDFIVILATLGNAIVTSILSTQVTTIVGDYTRIGGIAAYRQGRILGILNTAGDLGGAIGPLLAFALYPIIGLVGVYGISALILVTLFPLVLWVRLRY